MCSMNMDVSAESLEMIFRALDTDNRGYITTDQFISMFSEFYQSTTDLRGRRISTSFCDIETFVEALDPDNNGLIYFKDFKQAFQGNLDQPKDDQTCQGTLADLKTSTSPQNTTTTVKSMLFSEEPENKTDDSGVNLQETSLIDGDNDSLLSADLLHNPRIHRDEIHRSWPKYRGSQYTDSQHPESPVSASRSDIIMGDVENDLQSIRHRMQRMEERVAGMNHNHHSETESRIEILRDENARLSAQITILEERLKEADARAERNVDAERQHLQSIMARTNREHANEIETLRARIASLESECSVLHMDAVRMKADHQATKSEQNRNTEALSDAQEQIRSLKEQLEVAEQKHLQELNILRKDRNHAVHVLEEWNNSIGTRRRSRLGSLSPESTALATGDSELFARYQDSQAIVRRLRAENKELRKDLVDAQDQLFARSLDEGRSLVRSTEKSWASEIDNCTKEEVVELWTIEKNSNEQLRKYIERLTTRILERYPSLLEITHKSPTAS